MKTLRRAYWLVMAVAVLTAAFLLGLLCGVDIAGRSDGGTKGKAAIPASRKGPRHQ